MFGIKNYRNLTAAGLTIASLILIPFTINEYILLDVILINIFLALLSAEFARFLHVSYSEKNGFFFMLIFSMLCGFLTYLNHLYFIQLIVLSLYLNRYSMPKTGLLLAVGAATVFAFNLMVDFELIAVDYLRNNFAIPLWMQIAAFIISAAAGWLVADIRESFFAIGLLIFCCLLFPYFAGFKQTEYFSMGIPFLISSLEKYKVDRYLGKVLEE